MDLGFRIMEAVAKHDFNATADDELSFRKSQVLKVMYFGYIRCTTLVLSLVKDLYCQNGGHKIVHLRINIYIYFKSHIIQQTYIHTIMYKFLLVLNKFRKIYETVKKMSAT